MSQNYLVLSHSAMWRFVVLHTDQCLILTQMKNERLRGSRTGWHALATWAWAVTIRGGIRFSSGSKVLKDFFVENGLECDKAKLEKKVSRRIWQGSLKKGTSSFFVFWFQVFVEERVGKSETRISTLWLIYLLMVGNREMTDRPSIDSDVIEMSSNVIQCYIPRNQGKNNFRVRWKAWARVVA